MRVNCLVPFAVLVCLALALRALSYALFGQSGGVSLAFALGIVAFAVWKLGAQVARKYLLVAAALGGAVGLLYIYLDWILVQHMLLNVLHRPDDVARWVGAFMSALALPMSAICAVIAAVASFRMNPPTNSQP
jgi:hypothetical protein